MKQRLKQSEVLRLAAELIDTGESVRGCCLAIEAAEERFYREFNGHNSHDDFYDFLYNGFENCPYILMKGLFGNKRWYWFGSVFGRHANKGKIRQANKNHRVMALLMCAAMCEGEGF